MTSHPAGIDNRRVPKSDQLIESPKRFADLCQHIRDVGIVAFDTEFVSESRFTPQLCLLQFNTGERAAAVDPLVVEDLSEWWELFCDPDVTVVTHGSREEVRFCLRDYGHPPESLVDVQIAQGLLGRNYPLSYKALAEKVAGVRISTHETRTDWSRRPLSAKQLRYALEDVEHLLLVWDQQAERLEKLGRLEWAEEEFDNFVENQTRDSERDTFFKISGIQRLSRRELAVAERLHRWRTERAEKQDRPIKHILRDDLLVDIARRQPTTVDDLYATRGIQRKLNDRRAEELLVEIEAGLDVPESDAPVIPPPPRPLGSDETLGRLLGIALSHRCSDLSVATTLVGTQSDLQKLVRHHLGDESVSPRLLEGWRAEVCGSMLEDLLEGRVSIRVRDSKGRAPLVFEPVDGERAAEDRAKAKRGGRGGRRPKRS